MAKCQECGSHITAQFAKVFGNNNDDVFGCLHCGGVAKSDKRHSQQLDHTNKYEQ